MSIEHLVPDAKALIAAVVKNPALFHKPELAFLANFHATFIAPPEPQAGCPHDHSQGHSHSHAHAHSHEQAPEPTRFEEESEPSENEEEEDEGRVEPDDDPPADMGDASAEVTDEDRDAAQPAKQEAMELMSNGDYAAAIEKFTAVIKLAPSALAYANRAVCFATSLKPNAAIRDCNAALALNMDSAKALKTRGKAYRMLGEWDLAHTDLAAGQIIDFDPETDEVQRFVAAKVKAAAEKRKQRLAKDAKWREQQKARSASAGAGAGGFGGMGGMGGMGGAFPGMGGMELPPGMTPDMMQKLMGDPELLAAMQQPKMMAAFADIQANPQNMMQHMGDPEVMGLFMKLQNMVSPGM